MYRDPTKIRSHVVKLRLSDEENQLIQALANYTGEQTAPMVREMCLSQAAEIMTSFNKAHESS